MGKNIAQIKLNMCTPTILFPNCPPDNHRLFRTHNVQISVSNHNYTAAVVDLTGSGRKAAEQDLSASERGGCRTRGVGDDSPGQQRILVAAKCKCQPGLCP
jgi:hypothetical protein